MGQLAGVRFDRGGPVVWVDTQGQVLTPGQLVVVAYAQGEALASVVVGSGQIVENEPAVVPTGVVVRLASDADARALGGRAAMGSSAEAVGVPAGWSEWLAPPDAAPFVRDATQSGAPTATEFLKRRFPAAERSVTRAGRRPTPP